MSTVLSRHNRYLTAVGALAILAVFLVGAAYATTESQRVAIDQDTATVSQLREFEREFDDTIRDQEAASQDYLQLHDAQSLERYRNAVTAEQSVAPEFRAAAFGLPGLQKAIDDIVTFNGKLRTAFVEPAISAVQAGSSVGLGSPTVPGIDRHEALKSSLVPIHDVLVAADADLRLRSAALSTVRTTATAFGLVVMIVASLLALWLIRRYGRTLERDTMQAGVVNRFTEVTSFASDDTAIAASNLEALALLTHPDAAVTHVFNRSKDRAVPEAIRGDAIAEVLPMGGLSHCAGLVRGSMYVANDVAQPLSVHCPVYPVDHGTLACVPLTSGETVGAVHLYWERPNALPLELRASVVRVAEHAALAIGNRRLLAALQGQADTDPRTGLANSRAFDRAVEDVLSSRTTEERVSLLMLDLDHFKDFNDRFGHPGGDEALRAFGAVLRSCMRDGDLAARYGGEEFAVLLPGVDMMSAVAIAERIRERTESTVISVAPNQTARIAVSIGVSTAPDFGLDRINLLRIADEALYASKSGGRNRVTAAGQDGAAGASRRAIATAKTA